MKIKGFLVATSALCLVLAQGQTHSQTCDGDECPPAAYELQIINKGESEPRSTNSTEEGRADNRRVDITVLPNESEAQQRATKAEPRRVDLEFGGSVWIATDPVKLERSLKVTTANTVSTQNGLPIEPLEFKLKTNYASFIDRWEIRIWKEGASLAAKPIAVIDGGNVQSDQTVSWSGNSSLKRVIESDSKIEYAVRAYASSGAFDQNLRQSVDWEAPGVAASRLPELTLREQDLPATNSGASSFTHQTIPLHGATVRVYGMNINPNHSVDVNGETVKVSEDARFVKESLMPYGEHSFEITVENESGDTSSSTLNTRLNDQYFFLVGLADVMVGENSVSGSVEALSVDDDHYGGDLFVDGRLAFYLKGKVKGKYLVTAQMDTGLEDVSELFEDFHQKDPQSVFRRLDPEQYYPVYGDDSTLYDDTDSQGKLYVRVEWDRSHVLWGNYNTAFTGAELAPFNRSLYGAQTVLRSVATTELGDTRSSVSAFASNSESLFRHNEFLGTGGSLYYLRDTDIVSGSEKIAVEVRQRDSARVIERVELIAGRDYDIDDFQGRVILRRPLTSVSPGAGPSIIRQEPLDGYDTWLVVDYEIYMEDLDLSDATAGVRAKQWLGNHLGIGGTWAHEQRDQEDYDLKATDITLKASDNTYLQAEFAQTQSSQTRGNFQSDDGGLNFTQINTDASEEGGNAVSVEARIASQDVFTDAMPFDVALWAKRYEQGYSTAALEANVNTLDAGAQLVAKLGKRFVLSLSNRYLEQENVQRDTDSEAQIDFAATQRLTLSSAISQSTEKDLISGDEGTGLISAGKIAYDLSESTEVYLAHQQTLRATGSYTSNDSTTVGTRIGLSDRLNLNAEYTVGDRGNSALVGAEWMASDTYSVYANYKRSTDEQLVQDNVVTVGQRKQVNRRLSVYTEHQFTQESDREGTSHTFGLDQDLTDYTSAHLSFQTAHIEDENSDATERDAVSVGLNHQRNKVQASTKLEYRRDETALDEVEQMVTTNRVEYRRSDASRWQGKFNASRTSSRSGDENARFVEAGLGYAFRPVLNDRLNLLARATYLYDLKPVSQSTDPDQRSFILSTEGIYDITKAWSTGMKLAHRTSEIRLGRNTGDWVVNDASLAAVTIARRVPFGVRASASYQWLFSKETDSVRHGTLLSLGKQVSDHLLFSVGYNFTNFDDNLADDSYDVRGWFLNLVGTY
ncbi:MAG: hypothetical protein KTR35_10500 [Gammaproteobacteria bacterium]|nr:hypothetical protein [Gammaproteobacteria bacterium]